MTSINVDTMRNSVLIDNFWPQQEVSSLKWIRMFTLVIAGNILLVLASKASIPYGSVPFTFQTLAILLIGMAYGSRLGTATVGIFLAEGAAGLPVFYSAKAGLAYFAGPTAGYLVGFLVAVAVVGFLAERGYGKSPVSTLLAMLAGEIIIFALGLVWLSYLIGFEKAFQGGFLLFVPWECVKMAMAMALLPGAWKLVRRIRRDR